MATKKAAKKKAAKKPAAKKSAASKAPDMPDFARLRGVATFDMEDAVILVRSSCAEVAEAVKKRKKLKTWVRNALGKTVTVAGASYLIYQLKGHSWVTINGFTGGNSRRQAAKASPQDDAKALSKSLATKAIFFANSDTSSVTEYDLFENGRHIEHFDDFNGINFNSQFRDIEPPEDGPDIYTFVDAFIAEQDAFVTGWSHFLFDGWRYKKGDKVELDFGGVLNDTIIQRLDFVSA
jgi:hypothetical protein